MQVFISHSSRNDPHSAELRAAVCRRLRGCDYTVRVDVDVLRPGQEWRSVLYHWLAECDAAIVLLNQAALGSEWVHREVNILLWRQCLGAPPPYVVPVLIGIDVDALKANGFDELVSLQAVRYEPGDSAEVVVDKIMAEFNGLPPVGQPRRDLMWKWSDRIAHYLDQIDHGRRAELETAARALGVDEDDLGLVRASVGGRHFLAHQFLNHGHDGRLLQALGEIAPWMGIEPLGRLIREVVPTWVDGAAARRILPPRDRTERFVVALNARHASTAEQYIARATCCALLGYVHRTADGVAVGEGGADELLVEYEKAVHDLLGLDESEPLDGVRPPSGVTYFLVVKPSEHRVDLAAAAIRQLQDRFPWLVVILLTGSKPPSEQNLRDWRLGDVVVLRPTLQADDERNALMMIHQLRSLPARLRLAEE
jgi:hypothetical protein